MAKILSFVAGTPHWAGVLIGGIVVTAYFTAGGLLSSAWVNMVQLIVLVTGFAVALPWAWVAVGGWDAVVAATPNTPDYLNFWQGGESGWIYLALLAPNFMVSPGLIQKVYGAVDERAIRVGLAATAVALMLFALAPPAMGMLAHSFDPALADREHALMLVLSAGLPTLLGSLGLAAVFSAEISSADAILFMLATSLSKDLYKRFVRPNASDARVLKVARGAALAGGALSVVLALRLPSVIDALQIFYALMAVCLFVPVVAGLYSRLPGVAEALGASGVGVVTLISVNRGGLSVLDSSLFGVLALGVSVRSRGRMAGFEGHSDEVELSVLDLRSRRRDAEVGSPTLVLAAAPPEDDTNAYPAIRPAPAYTLKPSDRVKPRRLMLKLRARSTARLEGAPTATTRGMPAAKAFWMISKEVRPETARMVLPIGSSPSRKA